MFISFFTGKVMLFYGISLIIKEKSNASALLASGNMYTGQWTTTERAKLINYPTAIYRKSA